MTQPRAFSKVRSLACLALLLLFVTGSGAQQGTSGSIEGTITDQQGGAIANAKLTAVNAATGLTLQASSDDNGCFIFLRFRWGLTWSLWNTAALPSTPPTSPSMSRRASTCRCKWPSVHRPKLLPYRPHRRFLRPRVPLFNRL